MWEHCYTADCYCPWNLFHVVYIRSNLTQDSVLHVDSNIRWVGVGIFFMKTSWILYKVYLLCIFYWRKKIPFLKKIYTSTDRRVNPFVMLRERSTVDSNYDSNPQVVTITDSHRPGKEVLDNKLLTQRTGRKQMFVLATGVWAHSKSGVFIYCFVSYVYCIFELWLIFFFFTTQNSCTHIQSCFVLKK